MKPPKKFDCVQMKWEIQQRLAKELGEMPPDQARNALRTRIEQDPEFSKFLKRIDQAGRGTRPSGQ